MTNPLIAQTPDNPDGPGLLTESQGSGGWGQGIGVAESVADISQLKDSSSWVESGLAWGGAAMEGVSLAVDPIGTLLSYGLSWLIEHVEPLNEALDWFAGDPDGVGAYAKTWANVSRAVKQAAEQYDDAVHADTADWRGAAGDAYRKQAAEKSEVLHGAGELADTLSSVVETMGLVVGGVRDFVRDLVSDCVSRLITYALEAVCSFGLAIPVVAAQATTFIAKTVAKIAEVVSKLTRTLSNVAPKLAELAQLFGRLMEPLGRGAKAAGKGAMNVLDAGGKLGDKLAEPMWKKVDDAFGTDVVGKHQAKFGAPHTPDGGSGAGDASADPSGGRGDASARSSQEPSTAGRSDADISGGADGNTVRASSDSPDSGSGSRANPPDAPEIGGRSGGDAPDARTTTSGESNSGAAPADSAPSGRTADEGGASSASSARAPETAPADSNPSRDAGDAGSASRPEGPPSGAGSSASPPTDAPSRPASTSAAFADAPARVPEAPAANPSPPRPEQPLPGPQAGGAPAAHASGPNAQPAPSTGAPRIGGQGGWTGTRGSPGTLRNTFDDGFPASQQRPNPQAANAPTHRAPDADPRTPSEDHGYSTADSMALEGVPSNSIEHSWNPDLVENRGVKISDELREKLGDDLGSIKNSDTGLRMIPEGGGPFATPQDRIPRASVDPHRYTVEVHGSPTGARIGDVDLSAKELAEIIRGSRGYQEGAPVRLVSCQTGADVPDGSQNFAQQLAEELGVEVVAPSTDAWVDNHGNIYAAGSRPSFEPDEVGILAPKFDEPGEWHSFRPDGTKATHESPYPPGHHPTWFRDGHLAHDAHRRGIFDRLFGRTKSEDFGDPWAGPPHANHPPPNHPAANPPQQGYGPPQPHYGSAPTPQGYGPVQPVHGHSQPDYGPPQMVHGHPQPDYGPPQTNYRQPPPQPNYGPAHQGHASAGQPGHGVTSQQSVAAHGGPPAHAPYQGQGWNPRPPQQVAPHPQVGGHRQAPPHAQQQWFHPQAPPSPHPGPPRQPQGFAHPNEGQFARPSSPQGGGHPGPQTPSGQPPRMPHAPQGRTTPHPVDSPGVPQAPNQPHAGGSHGPADGAAGSGNHGDPEHAQNSGAAEGGVGDHTSPNPDGRAVNLPTSPARFVDASTELIREYLNKVLQIELTRKITPWEGLQDKEFTPGGELPPDLTREAHEGATAGAMDQVDIDKIYPTVSDKPGVVWRKPDDFLHPKNALFRLDMRPVDQVIDEAGGFRCRDPEMVNIGVHLGVNEVNSAFVSTSRSPEHALGREQDPDGRLPKGLGNSTDEELAKSGIKRMPNGGYEQVVYLHEMYHPGGIDTNATYHDVTQISGYQEGEVLLVGGADAGHIYRSWPRIMQFDDSGKLISAHVGDPVVNEGFKY